MNFGGKKKIDVTNYSRRSVCASFSGFEMTEDATVNTANTFNISTEITGVQHKNVEALRKSQFSLVALV